MSRKKRSQAQNKQHGAASNINPQPVASKLSLQQNWIIGLILAATFLAFFNTIFNKFAYDDTTQILQNESIRSFSNIPLVLTKESWFWRVVQDKDPNAEAGPTTPYYRPLVMIYLMIGWWLFGEAPAGWHILNILLHLISVYFAFLIIEHISKNVKLSAIATLLFAIHPLRVESVAWISGATDLLLADFMLPSFYLYLLYRKNQNKNYLAGSVVLFLVAAFAKEPAIMLPSFIFLYETVIANQERSFKERLKPAAFYSALFVLMSVVYFAMRLHALGFLLNDKGFVSYSFRDVVMTIPIVICKYIGLTFWPVNLSLFHATSMVNSPLSLRFILPSLIVIAMAFGLWQIRRSITGRFASLWFAVFLLPVLNLSAFSEDFLVQERYIYIPSIGLSLLVAMGLVKIPIEKWFTLGSRRTAQAALVGVLALLLTGRTLAQNTVWKDDMTMWEYSAEVASDQAMPHYILGHKYLNDSHMDKAIEELERYNEIDPKNLIVLSNLSAAHLMMYETQYIYDRARADRAHVDRAIALSQQGITINENSAPLWDTLGHAYTYDTSLKNLDKAVYFFERGLRVQPENAMLNFHLGATLVMQQKFDNALVCLERARKQAELPDIFKFIAMVYQARGQFQEAINNYGEYLKRFPNAVDAATISQQLNNLRAQLNNANPQS